MAVTFDDLVHPVGELNKSMFPDDDINVLSATWFDDAKSKTSSMSDGEQKDAAVRAWVYHRAFTTIAGSIASRPTSSDYYNQRQETWGADRVKYFSDRAKFYLDQYNTIVKPTVTGSHIPYSAYATRLAVW